MKTADERAMYVKKINKKSTLKKNKPLFIFAKWFFEVHPASGTRLHETEVYSGGNADSTLARAGHGFPGRSTWHVA